MWQPKASHKNGHAYYLRYQPVSLRAVQTLVVIERPIVAPQDMALLVSGMLLVLSWHYLANQVSAFDLYGLNSLAHVWLVAVAALALGQLARWLTPPATEDETTESFADELRHHVALAAAAAAASSPCRLAVKEGREAFVDPCEKEQGLPSLPHHQQQQQQGEKEQEDDMTVMKRKAQAEAAAKLDRYRAEVSELLAAIRKAAQTNSSTAVIDPQLLYRLAEQLFASPVHLSEFVMLRGLPCVAAAMTALARQLRAQPTQQQEQAEGKQQRGQPEGQQQEQQEQQQQPSTQQLQVLKALLQASWVLLQLANGPPACKTALEEPYIISVLLSTAEAVGQLPGSYAAATESLLRNLWWTLVILCGSSPSNSRRAGTASSQGVQQQQQLSLALQHVLSKADVVVSHLQQLVTLQHGPSAGWMAAAQLGLLVQGGHHAQQHHQQQQQQEEAASTLLPANKQAQEAAAAAAVQAMLRPESVAGLGYLLQHQHQQQHQQQQHQQQLSSHVQGLVQGLVHYLLTFHAPQLLHLLVEGQLVGSYAAGCPLHLGRLLVCQLLSSQGQGVLAGVEEEFELDVPLALAQIIPLKVHIKLPPAPQLQAAAAVARGHGSTEIEAADDEDYDDKQNDVDHHEQQRHMSAAAQPDQQQQPTPVQLAMANDTYTDVMACNLLLQHDRLHELLQAFCEEQQAAAAEQQQQQDEQQQQPSQPSLVSEAMWQLVQHLMVRDLQLHTVQHARGDSVAASVSSGSSGSSSSSIGAALVMEDRSGLYSSVLSGMVPAALLPGHPAGNDGEQLLVLPPLPAGVQQEGHHQQQQEQQQPQQGQQVVFQFGTLQHAVSAAMFRKIMRSSSFMRSVPWKAAACAGRHDATQQQQQQQQQQQRVFSMLSIPEFTDVANCWVLCCLERWLATKGLQGFSAQQAAKLWVAADFLQVNELQMACEDLMLQACREDLSFAETVAELCRHHLEPNARLLRLLVQQLLHGAATATAAAPAAAGASSSGNGSGAVAGEEAAAVVPALGAVELLQRLLAQHSSLLLPVVHAELRDRLLTLCIQNSNLDADCPDEEVE